MGTRPNKPVIIPGYRTDLRPSRRALAAIGRDSPDREQTDERSPQGVRLFGWGGNRFWISVRVSTPECRLRQNVNCRTNGVDVSRREPVTNRNRRDFRGYGSGDSRVPGGCDLKSGHVRSPPARTRAPSSPSSGNRRIVLDRAVGDAAQWLQRVGVPVMLTSGSRRRAHRPRTPGRIYPGRSSFRGPGKPKRAGVPQPIKWTTSFRRSCRRSRAGRHSRDRSMLPLTEPGLPGLSCGQSWLAREINRFAIRPDLTVFLAVPVDVGVARFSSRAAPGALRGGPRRAGAYRGEVRRRHSSAGGGWRGGQVIDGTRSPGR